MRASHRYYFFAICIYADKHTTNTNTIDCAMLADSFSYFFYSHAFITFASFSSFSSLLARAIALFADERLRRTASAMPAYELLFDVFTCRQPLRHAPFCERGEWRARRAARA